MEKKLDINDFYMTEYVCSGCGNICSRTYNCNTMIAEDHWGIPIPQPNKCFGTLRDDDEGVEHLKRLKGYAKRK